jgi:glycerol-3-phosphate acyltransferase PlsY
MPFLIIILSYLLGSIPTAYIAGRLIKSRDIRQMGDGNMGAQNALHQLGARIGFSVGIIDAVKGILAILIAQIAGISQASVLLAGTAAIIGHNWPVFLGFRGGRGESTTIGVLLTLATQPVLIAGSAATIVLLKTKNVIKASAVMFVPLPLICWWLGVPGLLVSYSIGLPCLVGFTHFIRTKQGLVHHAGEEKYTKPL